MPIEKLNSGIERISGVEGFDGMRVMTYKDPFTIDRGITQLSRRGAYLVNAQQQIAYILAGGSDQGIVLTNTVAYYFSQKTTTIRGEREIIYYAAFHEHPFLNFISLMYDQLDQGPLLFQRTSNPDFKKTLQEAEQAGRVVNLNQIINPNDESNLLELSTKNQKGWSDFGRNALVKTTLGDLAEPYAQHLSEKGCPTSDLTILHPDRLWELSGQDNTGAWVAACPVSIQEGEIVADTSCKLEGTIRGTYELIPFKKSA